MTWFVKTACCGLGLRGGYLSCLRFADNVGHVGTLGVC